MIPSISADAIRDYRFLLDRGYPERGSVALVGDRFRLSREERAMLFRGVSPTHKASERRRRLIEIEMVGEADVLCVDGHNVLLTVANYIRGTAVFETDDGVLRDIGGVHGRLHDEALMDRSIDLLAHTLAALETRRIVVCFDEPLSHSRRHMSRLSEEVEQRGPSGRNVAFRIGPSADELVIAAEPSVVATSDSALMDRTSAAVCDIARRIIEENFSPRFGPLPG